MGDGKNWQVHSSVNRSMYKLLIDRKLGSSQAAGSSTDNSDTWTRLWKLRVQPKIRVFWWRVLRGILPAFGELSRRHIMDMVGCAMCGNEEESLFSCFGFL